MIFQSFITSKFKFVNFIELSENAHKQIWQVRTSYDVRQFMFDKEVFPFENHLNFVERLKAEDTKLYYAIYDENNDFVASINLHPINYEKRIADWGIYINPLYQGKGVSIEIANLFFDYIFSLDVLDKITAIVLDFNLRSIKFHERVGFKREKESDGHMFFVKERL